MKRSLYLIALLGLLFILPACQKDDAAQDTAGLTSPSGVRLANDYESLSNTIEGFVGKDLAEGMEVTVQDIVWENVNGVEIAFVQYKDQTGAVSNIAIHEKGKGDLDPAVNERVVQTVSCKNNSCSEYCILTTEVNPNNPNQMLYRCHCSIGNLGCEVVITVTIVPDTVKHGIGTVVP